MAEPADQEAAKREAAHRWLDDPVRLERAARIVRAALARKRAREAAEQKADDVPPGQTPE